MNHHDAIDSLNKKVKRLDSTIKDLKIEVRSLNKSTSEHKTKIDGMSDALVDPSKNLTKFKDNVKFENAKKALQIQRAEKYQEQKERKEKLREMGKEKLKKKEE